MSLAAGDLSHGRLRALLARLVSPGDDWGERSARKGLGSLLVLFLLVTVVFLLAVGAALGLAIAASPSAKWLWTLGLLLILGSTVIGVLMYYVRYHLFEPLASLRRWALSMCNGDLSARISLVGQRGKFVKLASHINRLSDALEALANEMDDLVCSQTERLQEKNRSLEMLYDIAATVNASRELDDLLERTARKLMEVVGACGATVRLRTKEGQMRLSKSIGFEEGPDLRESQPRLDGNAFSEIEWLYDKQPVPEEVSVDSSGIPGRGVGLLSIPLRYQSQTLGVYTFLTPTPEVAENAEIHRLLVSVGKHVGMAVENDRLDKEGQHLSIMRERTSLAHELHDSLAQTLVSLRFQVKMLTETLESGGASPEAHLELGRIQNSLDEAHTELRELLTNFRGPIDARGLLPAMEELISRFRRESGIATYFQNECVELKLSAVAELQVQRIVSEILTNIQKHSRAQTVRILLRCDDLRNCRLLIEDDGIGMSYDRFQTRRAGEQFGLSIMHERARRLGGEVQIESEPGEGTQVLLTFRNEPLLGDFASSR
jgi:two-component system nitrate/nitrite sensor histidine kinase NarX